MRGCVLTPLAQARDHRRQQRVFGRVNFSRERFQGLARRNAHARLIENWTTINFRRHAVDSATRHLYAAPESLPDAVEPRKAG